MEGPREGSCEGRREESEVNERVAGCQVAGRDRARGRFVGVAVTGGRSRVGAAGRAGWELEPVVVLSALRVTRWELTSRAGARNIPVFKMP